MLGGMRTLGRSLVALHVAACLGACAADDENQDPSGAERVWEDIHADAYRSWDHAAGFETPQDSAAPHGGKVEIFVNDVVAEALAQKQPLDAWPDGSLIVKDGFDDTREQLVLVAVMDKRDGAWFWAEYDAEGMAKYSGTPSVCTGCHSSGDDFVRALRLPK